MDLITLNIYPNLIVIYFYYKSTLLTSGGSVGATKVGLVYICYKQGVPMEQIVDIKIFLALKSCVQSLRRSILFIERNGELAEFAA